MLSLRVVEHFDVIEHVLPGLVTCPVASAPDPFTLEQVEEALGYSIVMAISTSAHRMLKIVDPQEGSPVHAGKLAALIRMDQHLGLRLSSPNGHKQRLQHDVGRLTALHAPTHHAPGIEVDDHGEIGKNHLSQRQS